MEKIEKIQLGALLHDFGKIVRRSGLDSSAHSHAGYNYLKNLGLFKNEPEILDMVLFHHASEIKNAAIDNNSLAYLVYEADNIASGIDRRLYEGKDKGNEMSPLNSVFNKVHMELNQEEKSFLAIEQKEKDFNMPRKRGGNIEQSQYAQILMILKENLEAQKDYLIPEKLESLLESTCVYFPSSSFVDQPDISYYDHVKLTAAIAAAMYLYDLDHPVQSLADEYYHSTNSRKKEKFLYVSGEFSGIQDFIYTVTSKMAMKSLRGRSLYLELLIEHIIDEIFQAMSLSRVNLLYSGGSQFYMLLPNTSKSKQVLNEIQEKVNDFLLAEMGASVYFQVSSTPTTADQLGNNLSEEKKTENKVGEIYRKLSAQSSEGKLRRYTKNQLKDLLNENSEINKVHSYTKECTICKKPDNDETLSRNESETGMIVCNSCNNFIWLGKEAAKIYHSKNKGEIFLVERKVKSEKHREELTFPTLTEELVYLGFANKERIRKELEANDSIYRYYAINSYHMGDRASKNIWVGNYNIDNYSAQNNVGEQNLIEFGDLASKSKGIQRLAVLRADVDNLGTLFQKGFESKNEENKYQYATLSKTAVLSRYLSDFFKRKISLILEEGDGASEHNEIFKNYCHIFSDSKRRPRDIVLVYSGGDDLFAIGTWNDIIEFAVDLRQAFNEYTNAKISLSAGIGFFSHSYPVYQMAKITGELESLAKEYQLPGAKMPTKDAIALFGEMGEQGINHVYNWDRFIHHVLGEKLTFLHEKITLSSKEHPNKVFVGKSKLYAWIKLISNRIMGDGRIDVARFAYTMARLEKTKRNTDNHDELKKQLFQWIKDTKDAQELLTAIYLLIYELRGEKNE